MKRIFFGVIILLFLVLVFVFRRKSTYEGLDEMYVLRAHKIDEQTTKIWEKMLIEFPEDRCFMIFDNTRNSMTDEFMTKYPSKIITHTEDDCKKMNPLHEAIYSNVEATVVITYDALPTKSGFVWFIENDIYCDGNFSKALNIGDTQSDFITTHLRRYDEEPTWGRFVEFKGEIANIENSKKMACIFPIIRCSRLMIDLLRDNMGKSSGFCEGYFPTLASTHGLTCENMPPDKLGKFTNLENVRLSNLPHNGDNKLYHKFVCST